MGAIIAIVFTVIGALAGVAAFLHNFLKKENKDNKILINTEIDNSVNSNSQNTFFVEVKEPAQLIRALNDDKSYLLYSVIFINSTNETIIIRDIEALMSNTKGKLIKSHFLVLGTFSGNRAKYSIGITKDLIPLVLTPNNPKDVYFGFEFTSNKINVGSVELELSTSIGLIKKPLISVINE